MNVEGITWHAVVLDPEPFAATKALLAETFGLAPAVDTDGFVQFAMPNGTTLELYAPQAVPDYGYNDGGVAFGFRVGDIEAASAAVEAAGCELLGEALLRKLRLASGGQGGPDGSYARGDAAQGYYQGEERVHAE
jgi:hypothetical protein